MENRLAQKQACCPANREGRLLKNIWFAILMVSAGLVILGSWVSQQHIERQKRVDDLGVLTITAACNNLNGCPGWTNYCLELEDKDGEKHIFTQVLVPTVSLPLANSKKRLQGRLKYSCYPWSRPQFHPEGARIE